MKIGGFEFRKTCEFCPEQYDVKDKSGNQVAYIRFRWGELKCEYPDVGGEVIYRHCFDDEFQGSFESDSQRKFHLQCIAEKLKNRISL